MKVVVGLLIMLAVQSVNASTTVLFGDSEAVILAQGKPGEVEPIDLFNAMKVAHVDDGTWFTKSAELRGADGKPALSVICKISKVIENYDSCHLTIQKSAASDFDKIKKQLTLSLQYPESVNAANIFNGDVDGHIFFSADRHLGLVIDLSDRGTPMSFRLFYI